MRYANYNSVNGLIEVEIVRKGKWNTRVKFANGLTEVVSNNKLTEVRPTNSIAAAERVVPATPLGALYSHMRSFTGNPQKKFQQIQGLLGGRHGASGPQFIQELLTRSISAASFYNNSEEGFYSDRQSAGSSTDTFAPRFVNWISNANNLDIEGTTYQFVDFEIYPFRTTLSCKETGIPATHGNAGGIDLLLAATDKQVKIPTIVEIKAATETVGPTFAFIQALAYSAQMLTRNQFTRLRRHYNEFGDLNDVDQRVDILVAMQHPSDFDQDDLGFAKSLADGIIAECNGHIRGVLFLQVTDNGNTFEVSINNNI